MVEWEEKMANQQKVLHSMILQSPDHPEDPSNSPSNKDERSPPPHYVPVVLAVSLRASKKWVPMHSIRSD